MARRTAVLLLAVLFSSASANAAPRDTPFSQGKLRFIFGVGSINDYIVLSGGLGYYLVDGLELGVDLEQRFNKEPNITLFSPRITYTAAFLSPVAPYIGGFYRRWMYGNEQPDLNTLGGRAGLNLVMNRNTYIGAGAIYERFLNDCPNGDCDDFYPELFIGLTF